MVVLLGFLPQFLGQGYYGVNNFYEFLSPKTITSYRQDAYIPSSVRFPAITIEIQGNNASATPEMAESQETLMRRLLENIFPSIREERSKYGATVQVETEINKPLNFLINVSKSFVFVILGPFPWQIQKYSQIFVLFEIIPWYFLLFFIIRGAVVSFRRNRTALPLLVFSIMLFGVLALFVPNFGITTRIRMPALIALCCLTPLGFGKLKFSLFSNLDKYLDKYII